MHSFLRDGYRPVYAVSADTVALHRDEIFAARLRDKAMMQSAEECRTRCSGFKPDEAVRIVLGRYVLRW
jgi:hypothetical protein